MAGPRFSFRRQPRPAEPAQTRLPSHGPRPNRVIPLIPLLGACLIVVAVLQGVKLLYESSQSNNRPFNTEKRSMAEAVSRLGNRHKNDLSPIRVNAEVSPHDIQFTAPTMITSAHTVVVFTDPACGPCRAGINGWLRDTGQYGLRVVYKYWPRDRADTSAGMIMEIARRGGLAQKLMQKIAAYPGDVTPEQMSNMLDALGVSLNSQHDTLIKQSADLSATIGEDIDQGTAMGLGEPPQLVLDGYLLDGEVLSPARIPLYIGRLNRRDSIVQANDYWLNGGE